VPLPITFSPPGDGYVPSPADRLRDGIWLMLRADNVNRAEYSADPEDEDRDDERGNVHIFSDVEGREGDQVKNFIIVPQQLVVVAPSRLQFQYETARAGKFAVTISIIFYEAPDTAFLTIDPENPPLTVHAKHERVRRILMRGTLYADPESLSIDHPYSSNGQVVDPYGTPLTEEGL
jgi:hypothetical protein